MCKRSSPLEPKLKTLTSRSLYNTPRFTYHSGQWIFFFQKSILFLGYDYAVCRAHWQQQCYHHTTEIKSLRNTSRCAECVRQRIFFIGPHCRRKFVTGLHFLQDNCRSHFRKMHSSRSCTYTLFISQGGEIGLIFALRAAFFEIRSDFQNCHIWAGNSRSCTYTLFLHQGVEIELIFSLQAAVSKIRARYRTIFKIVPEVVHTLSFYPRVSILSLFLLYGR